MKNAETKSNRDVKVADAQETEQWERQTFQSK